MESRSTSLGISEDITDRHTAEERLNYLATRDHLTGLLNRHSLLKQFQEAWSQAVAGNLYLTVLYIDLDGFKEINDTLGHPIGDELLKIVANLLLNFVPEPHTVARVGGDEFIILLRDKEAAKTAVQLAEQIRIRCGQPFYVEDHEIFISASIGISAYPGPVNSHEELLRKADIAMYHAKAQGRNTFALYSPDMHAIALSRLEMRNYLRHAIESDELTIYYQPRVSIVTGRIVGAEALLRWKSQQLGTISPAVFIPIAEESGLINEIGAWVLRRACHQASEWAHAESGPVQVAVNLSPRQLRQAGLTQTIRDILTDSKLPPELLELEVTESALMDQGSRPVEILNEIFDMGIRLAVDDFGTGYSNLGYLKQLPVHVLKIDQSFVRGITGNASDVALVTAIVAMAKALSLSVTAEGIETRSQLEFMRGLGVEDYQGYYFSEPLPDKEFAELLIRQH